MRYEVKQNMCLVTHVDRPCFMGWTSILSQSSSWVDLISATSCWTARSSLMRVSKWCRDGRASSTLSSGPGSGWSFFTATSSAEARLAAARKSENMAPRSVVHSHSYLANPVLYRPALVSIRSRSCVTDASRSCASGSSAISLR